jgi:4-hydroxybenzoyl-CoA thioesterase
MYRKQELVRFQHCDPAGIVFYPRYVEMVNATVEDWFAEAVGTSFAQLHGPLRSAIPAVSLSLEFKAPTRLGEMLDLVLEIERLGRTSAHLKIVASAAGTVRFNARLSIVHVSIDDFRPQAWSIEVRDQLAKWMPDLPL